MYIATGKLIKIYLTFSIFLFHIRNIYIIHNGINIEIDNIINISIYENNMNFSNYYTEIKAIALYLPSFYQYKLNNNSIKEYYSEWEYLKNAKTLYNGHNQPRKPGDKNISIDYYDQTNIKVIIKQVELAKSHGIYGFGIYYYWFSGKKIFEKPLDIFLENKNIDFHFLLIWKNEKFLINDEIIFENFYEKNKMEEFIEDIKKYLIDSRYIKSNRKPIIGIYSPENILNLGEIISIWREKARKIGIGEIFILSKFNGNNNKELNIKDNGDGGFEIPPYNLNQSDLMKNNISYYYAALLYCENKLKNITNNYPIYRGIMLEYDNSPKIQDNYSIFDEYSTEKFYIINKLIIDWTKSNYDKKNKFIFINAWNNWAEGTYLEPDKKYGYASINSLSKALFNLPYENIIYNLSNFEREAIVLIQVHAFYVDLMPEIINKTNNIPVKFDLYVTTNAFNKQILIDEIIKNSSKAQNFEIDIVENKGRDVLPYLTQIKDIAKHYKYICHLHTKKTKFDSILGEKWRNYLYNNLFGDKDLISEILSDFENNNNLGLIFPETYYFQQNNSFKYNKNNIKYMNYLLGIMYPGTNYRIGKKIIFPVGNMFWARVDAIHQVFEQNIKNKCPKESNQIDATILHGIERIWLFVAKLNGYYYKTIFKYP